MGNNGRAIRQFVKERNAALLSLDKEKIQQYCKKYGVPIPQNEKAFWAGVHKAILHINAGTDEQKQNSLEWLMENGFSPDIK